MTVQIIHTTTQLKLALFIMSYEPTPIISFVPAISAVVQSTIVAPTAITGPLRLTVATPVTA